MNLVIFKNNLRVNDNPVVHNASNYDGIIPIYIDDTSNIRKKIGFPVKAASDIIELESQVTNIFSEIAKADK